MSQELNARNINALAEGAKRDRAQVAALITRVDHQEKALQTQTAEIKALRQDLILLRMSVTGSGATVR